MQPRDAVYWDINPDDPETLLLIPADLVERRYAAGRLREASDGSIEDMPVIEDSG